MQHVLEVVFPYLVALYLFDCLQFVGRHHLLLSSVAGRRYRLHRTGVHLAGVLPFGRAYATHALPVCVTARGVHYRPAVASEPYSKHPASQWRYIDFEALDDVAADGRTVVLRDGEKIKFPNNADARRWVSAVKKLRQCDPAGRRRKIRAANSRVFHIGRLLQLRTCHARLLRSLDVIGSLLFFTLFVFLPVALYSPLASRTIFDLLLLLIVALYAASLILACYSDLILLRKDRSGRIQHLLALIFSPVNAIHSGFLLAKDLYGRFAFPALCAAFLSREDFRMEARKEIVRIDHCLSGSRSDDWLEYWEMRKDALEGLLRKIGTSVKDIMQVPDKKDPAARWYCPACLVEYVKNAGTCFDCGAALKKF